MASGGVSAQTLCPAGKVMVLRDVDVLNGATGGVPLLYLRDALTTHAFAHFTGASGTELSLPWRGRQVFTVGEGFDFVASHDVWNVLCSGYLLDA